MTISCLTQSPTTGPCRCFLSQQMDGMLARSNTQPSAGLADIIAPDSALNNKFAWVSFQSVNILPSTDVTPGKFIIT